MKKHLLFLMLFAGSIMAFTSCKKDEDATLEGTWKSTKYEYLRYENGELRGSESEIPDPDDIDDLEHYGFSGNQWVRYWGDETPQFREDQTFTYSNGRLMLYDDGDLEDDFAVKTLNGRTLVLTKEETYNSNGVSIKAVEEYTYEKR